ncbi:MAG: hypothetical protein IKR77_00220 [Bacteroidales bacterium]|nr:hypothetical protein [Bacteroidales bacterium]
MKLNIQPVKKDRLPYIVSGLKLANAAESFMKAITQRKEICDKHSFEIRAKNNGDSFPKTIDIKELRTKKHEKVFFLVSDTNECVFVCKFSGCEVECLYNNRWNNFSGRAADIIKKDFWDAFNSLLPSGFTMWSGKRDEIYDLIYKDEINP